MNCIYCRGNTGVCLCQKNNFFKRGDIVKLNSNVNYEKELKLNKNYVIERIAAYENFTFFYFKNCDCFNLDGTFCRGHIHSVKGKNEQFIKVYNA